MWYLAATLLWHVVKAPGAPVEKCQKLIIKMRCS